ncbi:MAG TPA: DUF1214 domain-containing protein [Steroidobacteraceae bacterium]|nr:DUF1214 domain-containing protein [Steroidobacteraceae bacterium]
MHLNPVSARVPPAAQEAWEYYLQSLDDARARVLDSAYAASAVDRAQGLYYIQMLSAFAFNIYMAPRQNYPHFLTNTIFSPLEYSFGAPCPDFLYKWTFLDGRRQYRLSGKLGTTRWVELQAQRGFWGDADQRRLGNWDFDDFEIAADGSFEIFACAHRPSGRGQAANWMELDPSAANITVMVREAFYDWSSERGLELSIELLDRQSVEPVVHSEAEIDRRLRAAGFLVQFTVDFFLRYNDRILKEAGGTNGFYVTPMQSSNDVGGNPRAGYMQMMYDIQPGEALILEVELPQARYWSAHLADLWWQTTDYAYHQSSLNGHQARIDSDGKVRIVLSQEDPGVPNWLDPVDNPRGLVLWRWYLADSHPTPTVRSVPLTELRRHLPEGTPRVTPEQRRLEVRARTAFVRRNYRL